MGWGPSVNKIKTPSDSLTPISEEALWSFTLADILILILEIKTDVKVEEVTKERVF